MDIGWSELMVIGIVALVVIGPKDLPGMFRELGRFTAKLRAMGREFSRAMEDAARETGVQDVADDLRKVTQIVYSMIQVYGMNDRIGNLAFPKQVSRVELQ